MNSLESTVTVAAYFVAEVEIHDPAGFQPYHEQFQDTLTPYGGPAGIFRGRDCPPGGDGRIDRTSGDCRFPFPPGGTELVCFARLSKNSTAPPTIRTDPGLLRRRTPRAEAMKQAGAILH